MKGFKNIGNTCYLNSGLQMLIQNEDLCNMILKHADKSEQLAVIAKMINDYYSKETEPVLTPVAIKQLVQNEQDIFYGFGQQDSTEFIICLLNIIDDEIKKQNNSLNELFGININTRTKCKFRECLKISNKIDSNLFLMLDLNHTDMSLDDSYRHIKEGETLTDDDKYYCDNCKEKRIASKRTNIESWPSHLFVWLKRFKQNGRYYSKLDQHLDIPLVWRHNNVLKGAVLHYGGLHGGHYVYMGIVEDKWYLFNDGNVSEIPTELQVKKLLGDAYWLYYKKES